MKHYAGGMKKRNSFSHKNWQFNLFLNKSYLFQGFKEIVCLFGEVNRKGK